MNHTQSKHANYNPPSPSPNPTRSESGKFVIALLCCPYEALKRLTLALFWNVCASCNMQIVTSVKQSHIITPSCQYRLHHNQHRGSGIRPSTSTISPHTTYRPRQFLSNIRLSFPSASKTTTMQAKAAQERETTMTVKAALVKDTIEYQMEKLLAESYNVQKLSVIWTPRYAEWYRCCAPLKRGWSGRRWWATEGKGGVSSAEIFVIVCTKCPLPTMIQTFVARGRRYAGWFIGGSWSVVVARHASACGGQVSH
jgi:lambda repressor-like predicted transcriptional regulator